MLLVLYREYVARMAGTDIESMTYSYKQWLDWLIDRAEDSGQTLGGMIREDIDPTYAGV